MGARSVNTSDLIKRIAAAHPKLYRRDAERVVAAVLGEIYTGLRRGNRVSIKGFGTFLLRRHGPRKLHDPNTSTDRIIPSKVVIGFQQSKTVKRRLNE